MDSGLRRNDDEYDWNDAVAKVWLYHKNESVPDFEELMGNE